MLRTTRKSVKLQDVATLAGIDIATASRALNGKAYVSSATRDAALKAAQELRYQPNLHAQRLANGHSHNVVGLFHAGDLGVAVRQASFIEHRLDELGFEVEVHTPPQFVSNYAEKQAAMLNKVRRQRPGAILFESALASSAIDELRLFMEEGGVVVGYGEPVDLQCDQVHFDSEHRAYLAARHLLELEHRDIGICFHGPVSPESADFQGFARALEERNIPVQDKWLFAGGNYEEGGARLAEAFLNWPERPTGLCIINDVSASAFIAILARNGLSIPDDVSVVGFDDVLAARYGLVPLTTVNYPLELIGRQIIEFTQSRFKGYNGPPRRVVIQSELITRSSSAPPTRKQHCVPEIGSSTFAPATRKPSVLR